MAVHLGSIPVLAHKFRSERALHTRSRCSQASGKRSTTKTPGPGIAHIRAGFLSECLCASESGRVPNKDDRRLGRVDMEEDQLQETDASRITHPSTTPPLPPSSRSPPPSTSKMVVSACRRSLLLLLPAATSSFLLQGSLSFAEESLEVQEATGASLDVTAAGDSIPQPYTANPPQASPPRSTTAPDTTITSRVFLDFRLCPSYARQDRTLGNPSLVCSTEESEPLGRVVIGLYGNHVPTTVANFLAMVTGEAGSSYRGSIVNKLEAGQFILVGKQGSPDKGEVGPPSPSKLPRFNPEILQGSSFRLPHFRPGTVSLALAENNDEERRKGREGYRNVEFLVTTGPGPAPSLDNGNIVFGAVLEGFDVLSSLSSVPTFRPNERIRQFNTFASFLGDERAATVRDLWSRPMKSIVIENCGVLPP